MSRVNTFWRADLGAPVHSLPAGWFGCAGGSQVAGGSLQLWIVSYLGSLPRVLGLPGDGKASLVRSGWTITPLPSPLLPSYSAPVSLVVTCAGCREAVLNADLI